MSYDRVLNPFALDVALLMPARDASNASDIVVIICRTIKIWEFDQDTFALLPDLASL